MKTDARVKYTRMVLKKALLELMQHKPVNKITVKEIAERKMPDLTANTIEAAMSQVAGTCRSMGIVVVD